MLIYKQTDIETFASEKKSGKRQVKTFKLLNSLVLSKEA